MTYHDEPYYECNHCGEILDGLECSIGTWCVESFGWTNPSYNEHYCPECSAIIEEDNRKEEQYKKDIESGKIKIKEPKKPPIPKWCPNIKLYLPRCTACKRLSDCPYPDLRGVK